MREFERELPWLSPPPGGLERLQAVLDAQANGNRLLPAHALAPVLSFVLVLALATLLLGYQEDAEFAASEARLRALAEPVEDNERRRTDDLHLVAEAGEGVRLYFALTREGPPAAELDITEPP